MKKSLSAALTLNPPLLFCPENVCFLHLMHIFKFISDDIFFMEANNMNPDETTPKQGSKGAVCSGFLLFAI